jgi:hypothetical protein
LDLKILAFLEVLEVLVILVILGAPVILAVHQILEDLDSLLPLLNPVTLVNL